LPLPPRPQRYLANAARVGNDVTRLGIARNEIQKIFAFVLVPNILGLALE
jgi:hypothetical protein